ncbi:flagellar FlbD family protein [Paenibacillus ginsengihumi]|uniref:flagellar FlbD family protein n=1 Tax=Paenibacillus ginsengihumi TaxID=431596 RepID=UPI0003639F6F|nr:flagellar FlbD family protein [Paenibacillus ginsengihumi]
MIGLTRLNGRGVTINALLIETVEETPDTMITLVNGKKFMVLESVADVLHLTQQFYRKIGLTGGVIKSLNSEGS